MSEHFSMLLPQNQTEKDVAFSQGMEEYFSRSMGTNMDKLRNFAKFVPRQALSQFLAKYELFQQVLNVHGHIIECGVFPGRRLDDLGTTERDL